MRSMPRPTAVLLAALTACTSGSRTTRGDATAAPPSASPTQATATPSPAASSAAPISTNAAERRLASAPTLSSPVWTEPRRGEEFVRIDYLDLEVSAPGPASVAKADPVVVRGTKCDVELRADLGLVSPGSDAPRSDADTEWIDRDTSHGGWIQVARRIGRMPVRCRGKLAEEACVRETCASLRPIRGGIAEEEFSGTTLIQLSSLSGWGKNGGVIQALGSGRVMYSGPSCPKARVFADRDPARLRALVSAARDAGFFTAREVQPPCHDCLSYRIGIYDGADGRVRSFTRSPGREPSDADALEASLYALLGPNPCANYTRETAATPR